jgi:hypothetical protein
LRQRDCLAEIVGTLGLSMANARTKNIRKPLERIGFLGFELSELLCKVHHANLSEPTRLRLAFCFANFMFDFGEIVKCAFLVLW